MNAQQRVDRYDSLFGLFNALSGADFGGSPACRDEDPELFFPVSEKDVHTINAAKAVCRRCPVQGSCLKRAMDRGEQGIWGGTTESERATLRRLRREAAAQGGSEGVAA